MERELFRADWAAAEEAWGADVTLARLAGAEGTVAAPLFTAHLDIETLRRLATGQVAPAGSPGPAPSGIDRRCELEDGTVLTPHHLLPWLRDAQVERVVLDPAGRVLDLGRRSRLFRGTHTAAGPLTAPAAAEAGGGGADGLVTASVSWAC